MAILTTPTECHRSSKTQKWHLAKESNDSVTVTVCSRLIWAGVRTSQPVADVRAADLCRRCLGAMIARDRPEDPEPEKATPRADEATGLAAMTAAMLVKIGA